MNSAPQRVLRAAQPLRASLQNISRASSRRAYSNGTTEAGIIQSITPSPLILVAAGPLALAGYAAYQGLTDNSEIRVRRTDPLSPIYGGERKGIRGNHP